MPFFPRLTIFDLDGTLIDYEHDYLYSEMLRIVQLFGLHHISAEQIGFHHDRDDLFGCIDCDEKRKAIEQSFYHEFRLEQRPTARLIPGTIEALDYLATRDVRLAIATARHQLPESIREELKATGLLNWIDCITTRSCHTISWRDKSPQIQLACQHAAIDPSSSFMVGDNPSDALSARAVGIGGIVSVRTGRIIDDLLLQTDPHHILNSVAELPEVLKDHESS